MIFKLLSVSFDNFKAYVGHHEWMLPDKAGLYYITGQNQYNKRLGANGIGKSTLVDAINWVVFGRTSRGLRATDVVSWGKSSCRVTAIFQIGDETFIIERSQHPNHILINSTPGTQSDVDKLIRLNQEAFNNSMILPQFGSSFLDLSPAAKLIMFSEVMDLDYWLDRSKVADGKADQLIDAINSVENKISYAQGSIERLRGSVKDLRNKSSEFAESIENEIKLHESEIKSIQIGIKLVKAKLAEYEQKLKASEAQLSEAKQRYEHMGQLIIGKGRRLTELETLLKANERRTKELHTELLHIENLIDKVCPTCLQKVGKEHSQKHQLAVIKKTEELEAEATGLANELEKVHRTVDAASEKYDGYRKLHTAAEQHYSHLLDSVSGTRNEIGRLEYNIGTHTDAVQTLRQKTNPFEEMIAANIVERRQLKKRITKLNDKVGDLKTLHEATAFWIKGFKRVRLFVIEEALTALEIEVNNLLVTLGLVDWKITLDVERENKSGGVTKGFTVLIHSPRHEKPVRFESFSGGEVQRLRLAADLGLSNLIMEQAGFENMVEMIDEPSEHLSLEGIEDLIETISQRAVDTGKQIWLIEHHSLASNLFDGTLHVNMNKKGKASFSYA